MSLPYFKIKHKKTTLVIFIVLVAFISLGILLNRLEQPNEVQAIIGKPVRDQPGFNISLNPTSYADSFVAFKYPDGLTKKPSSQLSAINVDIINFEAQDVLSWTLAIDITNTGSQPLSNDSSYKLRLDQPSIYKLATLKINSQSIPVMTDTAVSGFNEVAFLQHNNLRATVALTGDDATGTQPLLTTWNMVLNSWHWQ